MNPQSAISQNAFTEGPAAASPPTLNILRPVPLPEGPGSSVPAVGAMDLLRFNTCGNVDDGKSTLIGRLLYDSKSLMEDQLEALERSSDIRGGEINLANVTDGLRAERQQGITIDVAYRYFSTPRRKFIVADTPGHVQYTRNMVTGASTANLSIILVDARSGVLEQSRRHACLAGLLRIPHLVIAINKMDLVNWSESRYQEIRAEFESFLPRLDIKDVKFIPMSALKGDNVVHPAAGGPWYAGPPLLDYLENVHIASDWNLESFRLPVQWVNRPNVPANAVLHDFRGLSGQVAGGIIRRGEKVIVLPSGLRSEVKEILTIDGPREEAFCPQSITLVLKDDIDVSRGDTVVAAEALPYLGDEVTARLCWMHPRPLVAGQKLLVKHTSRTAQVVVAALENRIEMQTLEAQPNPPKLGLNDIGQVRLVCASPLVYDTYAQNRVTGSFILIDPATNSTVAAGMLQPPRTSLPLEYTDFAI